LAIFNEAFRAPIVQGPTILQDIRSVGQSAPDHHLYSLLNYNYTYLLHSNGIRLGEDSEHIFHELAVERGVETLFANTTEILVFYVFNNNHTT